MRFEEWYGVNGVAGFVPLTNIVRKDNAFEVDLAVPGYTEDQLHLAIENGVLQIQGTVPESEDNQQYIRREIRQRPFRYQVELPDGAETDAIEAHLDLGVLRIRIPLQPKRRITVAVKTPEPVA